MRDPERLIAAAKSFLHLGEGTNHDNTSQVVDAFLKIVGLEPGYPWCAAFLAWCGFHAFMDEADQRKTTWPLPLTGGCAVLGSWAKKQQILLEPTSGKRGDLFLLYFANLDGGRFGHVGIILQKLQDGSYLTIEGNSNLDGSRDGYEVCLRKRRPKPTDRVIHWSDLP